MRVNFLIIVILSIAFYSHTMAAASCVSNGSDRLLRRSRLAIQKASQIRLSEYTASESDFKDTFTWTVLLGNALLSHKGFIAHDMKAYSSLHKHVRFLSILILFVGLRCDKKSDVESIIEHYIKRQHRNRFFAMVNQVQRSFDEDLDSIFAGSEESERLAVKETFSHALGWFKDEIAHAVKSIKTVKASA